MSKELVLLDIDDVIAANAEGFIAWSNHEFGTNLKPIDYTEDFTRLWPGIGMDEIQRRANLFHGSDAMLSYGHIEEGATSLQGLTERYRFIAATSRRRVSELITRTWIEQSYAGIFEDVVFAGIYDEPTRHGHHLRTKADVYRKLKPDYVVDDQAKHCFVAAELGVPTVLFGNYSWTPKDNLPGLVTWCKDWRETREYFEGKV